MRMKNPKACTALVYNFISIPYCMRGDHCSALFYIGVTLGFVEAKYARIKNLEHHAIAQERR